MDIDHQGREFGRLEITWNASNPEKVPVAIYVDNALLVEKVLSPLDRVMELANLDYHGISVRGEIKMVPLAEGDQLYAEISTYGEESEEFVGVLCDF